MTDWYIGQKVVCIEANWNPTPAGPAVGDICTIRGFDTEELDGISLWFDLEEWTSEDWYFEAGAFRPLVS